MAWTVYEEMMAKMGLKSWPRGHWQRMGLLPCLVSARAASSSYSGVRWSPTWKARQADVSPCYPVEVENRWAWLKASESLKRRVTDTYSTLGSWERVCVPCKATRKHFLGGSCQWLQPPTYTTVPTGHLFLGKGSWCHGSCGWGAPAGEVGSVEWGVTVTRLNSAS